jgi:iron(III) transport system permease protein
MTATALAPSSNDTLPRRTPRSWVILGASALVALVLLLPLVFLVLEATKDGGAVLFPLLFRRLTFQLLWNTVRLTVVVTALCAVVGTLAAWCVERTDLPWRRLWAIVLVVPLAIPDFVVSFGWVSVSRSVQGFWGAVLVMTLAVYPLVYLPVAASLRGADPAQEEVARGLGLGKLRTFWRVTLGQARIAILGGCLLVALVLLAEYGAFEILGYNTFTTEIFTEIETGFDVPTACVLSLVLVVVSLLVLTAEAGARGRGRGRLGHAGPGAQRVTGPHRLGRATVPVVAALGLLTAGALGVPVGAIFYLMIRGGSSTLPDASIGAAAWHTAFYSGSAAALTTLMALPVAVLAVRHRGRVRAILERSTYIVLAMPGVVVALALTYFSNHYAAGFLYQSSWLLIAAYAILFFPLALVCVRASVAQSPVALEEVARSLGLRRLAVLRRVVLPLVGPGLAAAFCLVFLSAVTELTATLILIPLGAETLTTQFWAFQTDLSYGQAAPYAAIMIGIAVVPSYVLGRWFDRLPSRATATT